MTRPARGALRDGFTLLEVMVSMTVLAIIATIVYQGFAQTGRNKVFVQGQVDRYHSIGMAMERMVRELSTAYVSTHRNRSPTLDLYITTFVGTDGGSGDRVDFNSLSHQRLYRDSKESDQNELSYFLADSPEGEGKVLARRLQSRVDDKPGEGGRTELMLEDVLDFQLRYLDQTTNEWKDTWDTTTVDGQSNRLPAQMKIVLTVPPVSGKGSDEVFGTRVVLGIQWALNQATYMQ